MLFKERKQKIFLSALKMSKRKENHRALLVKWRKSYYILTLSVWCLSRDGRLRFGSQVLIFSLSIEWIWEGEAGVGREAELWKVSSAIQLCVPRMLPPMYPARRAQSLWFWGNQWKVFPLGNRTPQGGFWKGEQNPDTTQIPCTEWSCEGPGYNCGPAYNQVPVGCTGPTAPGLGGGTPGSTMGTLLIFAQICLCSDPCPAEAGEHCRLWRQQGVKDMETLCKW